MRRIKIQTHEKHLETIKRIAFATGVDSISIHNVETHRATGETDTKLVFEVETSTPQGRDLVARLIADEFFDPQETTFTVRQGRSIVSRSKIANVTYPLAEPSTDLLEELWQSSHLTLGLTGRIFISGLLIGYGIINQQILVIIGGLLFLPLLPMLLAIGFGSWCRQWKLVLYAARSLAVSIVLLIAGGVFVASLSQPPLRYTDFPSIFVSLLISGIVGVAAGLASIDDAGRRELIGLAAAAQIGIIPVWVGVCVIFGVPTSVEPTTISQRLVSLALSIAAIICTSLAVFVIFKVADRNLNRLDSTRA